MRDARFVAQLARGRHEQVRIGALVGATDAPAQLIKLRQSEQIRAVDDDGVGARNVQPAFDDGGRHEHVVLALDEVEHGLFQARFAHLTVADRHARRR